MKIATAEELQTNLSAYLDIVQNGGTVFIRIKNGILAELTPVKDRWKTAKADIESIRNKILNREFSDSSEMIREDRDSE